MYRAHHIEFKSEDRGKAYPIIHEHYRRGEIDDYRFYDDTVGGVKRTICRLHLYVSDDLQSIEDDFRKEGIELF